MTFEFTVTAQVERVQGKFVGRDEIEEAIQQAIEEAQPSLDSMGADSTSEYEITDWDVSAVAQTKKR